MKSWTMTRTKVVIASGKILEQWANSLGHNSDFGDNANISLNFFTVVITHLKFINVNDIQNHFSQLQMISKWPNEISIL